MIKCHCKHPCDRTAVTETSGVSFLRIAKNLREAVKWHCMDCNGVLRINRNPAEDCTAKCCPIYPYRPWNGPGKKTGGKKRVMSEENKAKLMAARGKKAA